MAGSEVILLPTIILFAGIALLLWSLGRPRTIRLSLRTSVTPSPRVSWSPSNMRSPKGHPEIVRDKTGLLIPILLVTWVTGILGIISGYDLIWRIGYFLESVVAIVTAAFIAFLPITLGRDRRDPNTKGRKAKRRVRIKRRSYWSLRRIASVIGFIAGGLAVLALFSALDVLTAIREAFNAFIAQFLPVPLPPPLELGDVILLAILVAILILLLRVAEPEYVRKIDEMMMVTKTRTEAGEKEQEVLRSEVLLSERRAEALNVLERAVAKYQIPPEVLNKLLAEWESINRPETAKSGAENDAAPINATRHVREPKPPVPTRLEFQGQAKLPKRVYVDRSEGISLILKPTTFLFSSREEALSVRKSEEGKLVTVRVPLKEGIQQFLEIELQAPGTKIKGDLIQRQALESGTLHYYWNCLFRTAGPQTIRMVFRVTSEDEPIVLGALDHHVKVSQLDHISPTQLAMFSFVSGIISIVSFGFFIFDQVLRGG